MADSLPPMRSGPRDGTLKMGGGRGEQQVRAFISIESPAEVKTALSRVRDRLGSRFSFVRWVDPAAMHLTLKFLGDVEREKIESVVDAMRQAASGIAAFSLETTGLGMFPNARQPRVLWVGIVGDTGTLMLLQDRVEMVVSPLGFPREARPFTAHLTLARVRDGASGPDRAEFGERVGKLSWEAKLSIPVGALSLMRSELKREGAIYTRLAEVKLGGGSGEA
ncbi:MAG: RNA 2',3'-cyclic phosphodiesterase [Chloroflexota bacterium]